MSGARTAFYRHWWTLQAAAAAASPRHRLPGRRVSSSVVVPRVRRCLSPPRRPSARRHTHLGTSPLTSTSLRASTGAGQCSNCMMGFLAACTPGGRNGQVRSSKIKKVRGRGTHFNAFMRQPPNYFFGGGNSRCLKVKCYAVHNA